MMKKWIALLLAVVLMLSLWGCGDKSKGTVYVENVGKVVENGSIAINDKFPGVVIAEDRVEVQKDDTQTVAALHVEVGQEVNAGDLLFSYDSDVLNLELSKLRLDLERLNNTVTTLKTQIEQLKKEQKAAPKEDQLSYTVEIQDREAQLQEAEYNVKVKNKEIEQTNTALSNVEVRSPITGRIISVDAGDTGEFNGAYIVIQQFGNYRVKGTINELNMGSLTAGAVVSVTARGSSNRTWKGVITSIDLESAQQPESINPDSSMTTSSSYSFYVELEDSQGLMLGQHVYMELSGLVSQNEGIWLPEYYICYDSEGNVFVWAEDDKGLLERRAIVLGGYDDASYTVEIVSGLSAGDYIAFPSESCRTGATAIREDGTVSTPQGSDPEQNSGDTQQTPSTEAGQEGAPDDPDMKDPNGSSGEYTGQENDPDQIISSVGGADSQGNPGNSGSSGDSHGTVVSDGDLDGDSASSDGDLGG